MQFTGLSASQVFALLGAASAITLALYLLRQRRRQVAVPFIPLWEQLLRDQQSTRLFQSLKRLLSLLLSLLLVALLAFALGDPRKETGSAELRHTLLLVDAGLTMQATDVAPSRFAAARERARTIIARAGPSHRMLLAQLDASAAPLSPMTSDRSVLERGLEVLAPTEQNTDIDAGYAFALNVLHGLPNSRLIVISDADVTPRPELARALRDAGVALEPIILGKPSPNVAITAFAARRYRLDRNRSELLLELQNASKEKRTVQVTLLGDDRPIDVQQVTVAAGARSRRIYDDITGVERTLEARLSAPKGSDFLAVDDRAYAVMPEHRRVSVLCVTDGSRYLEAALLLDEYLDVTVTTPEDYAGTDGYDVAIFDRFVPPAPPAIPTLYLHPDGEGGPLEVTGEIERPFADKMKRKHPLLRFTALGDVNIARALRVRTAPDDEVIAADANGPLIVAGRRGGHPFVAVTFDVNESDLPLRVAWPLFLLNTIDFFTGEDSAYVASQAVGETLEFELPSAGASARVVGPGGEAQSYPAPGSVLTLTPEHPGFYRLEGGGTSTLLAVNLPAGARTDLTPPAEASAEAARSVAQSARGAPVFEEPPWVLLLAAAAALLSIEWLTYHRRWTV